MLEYLIYCKCIDDITKLKDCEECPHKSKDSENFECTYNSQD